MSWSTKQLILDECLKYLKNPTVNTEEVLWIRVEQYLRNLLNLHKDIYDCILCLHPELIDHLIKRFRLYDIPIENSYALKQKPAYVNLQLKNTANINYIEDLLIARLLFN